MRKPAPSQGEIVGAAGEHYGRRWLKDAFSASRDWFGLHFGVLMVAFLGPSVGYFLFAYATAGSEGINPAAEATRWLLFGFGGTLLLFLAAFIVQLVLTPAAIERQEAEAWRARQLAAGNELAQVRAALQNCLSELDTSRLEGVEIAYESAELLAIDVTDDARDSWLAGEQKLYVESVKPATERGQRRMPSAMLGYLDLDRRTGDEFVEELRGYLGAMKERWIAALRAGAISRKLAVLRPVIRNLRDVSVEAVEVQMTLPANVGAGWEEDVELDVGLPEVPKPWGEDTIAASISIARPPLSRPPDPGRIERIDGRLVITWDRVDLSGLGRQPLTPVRLFIPGSQAGRPLPIEWRMVSLKRRGGLSGTVFVPLAPALVAPASALPPRET